MKKIGNCIEENCIETPTSCSIWNGGDIPSLEIKDGESLNNVIIEIAEKLKDIGGEDISSFDIDTLLDICNLKAPLETTLIGILTLLRDNQICLKDYIETLSSRISEINQSTNVKVNLRCFADLDNLGNSLEINREGLDQLVIDNLCEQRKRIIALESEIVKLNSGLNNIDLNPQADEANIGTCVDPALKPTSTQVIKLANEHCDLVEATGTPVDIAAALAKVPNTWNKSFGLLQGWDLTPDNQAQVIGNLLLVIANQEARLKTIETTCCAPNCDNIKIGFSATLNDAGDGILFKFSSGAGTSIPAGFTDKGSTGTIKDMDGNVESFSLSIANGLEDEVFIDSLNKKGDFVISINAKIGNDSLLCEKCLDKTVKMAGCGYCEITATGAEGSSAIITYEDGFNDTTVVSNSSTTV